VLGAVLVWASPAAAAIFLRLATIHVQRGGVVRVFGNPRHMPLYALPVRRMACIVGHYTCPGAIRRTTVPRRPFVMLGHAPGTTGNPYAYDYTPRAFTIRLPRALPAGKYVVFVWCSACGGSLIPAWKEGFEPQTLNVRR
jgi:hypothetical protein